METIEIIGYKRANLGKTASSTLRAEAKVPCVLYGGAEQLHFYVRMADLEPLVYTSNTYFVALQVEGTVHRCILQDMQFHPVNEMMMHADFLVIDDAKPIKLALPIVLHGTSPGVVQGGLLVKKLRKIQVKGLPTTLPQQVEGSINGLELGGTLKVRDLQVEGFEVLNPPAAPVARVEIPRALRSKRGAEAAAE